jgi:octaprenyl-diphosphate synthase
MLIYNDRIMKPAEAYPIIADDLAAVDTVIRQRLSSEVPLINTVADYIIAAGGKRMRPSLLALTARALGYDGSNHYLLGAVIEFIHTATLLHDDVVDDSDLRRGRPTANQSFGNPTAVLVGDFLYSRAFQMMVEAKSMPIMQVLANATNTIAEGEVLQLMNINDPNIDEGRYLQVIRYKTAKLFEAAGEVGAILAGANSSVQSAMAAYGRHLGTAFQLVDDALDYAGDSAELGKSVGDDLREGKATLPLIYLLQKGNREVKTVVRKAIEDGQSEDFEMILEAIKSTGALDYTMDQAKREAKVATDSLSVLPTSIYKDALLYYASFSVERKH